MYTSYMQTLHPFIKGTWAPEDFDSQGGSWNPSPLGMEGQLCCTLETSHCSQHHYALQKVMTGTQNTGHY